MEGRRSTVNGIRSRMCTEEDRIDYCGISASHFSTARFAAVKTVEFVCRGDKHDISRVVTGRICDI